MSDQTTKPKDDEEAWKDSDFLCFDDDDDKDDDDDDVDGNNKDECVVIKNDKSNNNKYNSNLNASLDSIISKRRRDSSSSSLRSNDNSNSSKRNSNGNNSPPKRLPPWMDKPHEDRFHYNTPKLILLHEEIVQFVNLMKPQQCELDVRNEFVQKVKDIILNLFNGSNNNKNKNNGMKEKTNNTTSSSNSAGAGAGGGGEEKDGGEKCEVHVFGSMATGLILPSSDIDFVVMLPGYDPDGDNKDNTENNNSKKNNNTNQTKDGDSEPKDKTKGQKQQSSTTKEEERKEMEEYDIHKHLTFDHKNKSPLQQLANELRRKWKDELIYIEVVENTKVPIVKFTHGPTKISADICFNQYNGVQAAELMKRFMDVMPPLKPLTFVLKYFMAVRGLNEPYSGGCGSFMIQLMLVSFLQHRERYDYNNYVNHRQHVQQHQHKRFRYDDDDDDDYDVNPDDSGYQPSPMNLGSLLMEFFELYGMDFNYLTTAISVRNDGYYFPKGHHNRREYFFTNPSRAFTLGIENPIDITMDVGKPSFRMPLIQRSYEVALRVLLSHVALPAIPTDSILESIIPPTEEMYQRATMNKVLNHQGYDVNNDKGKRIKRRRMTSTDSSMEMSESEAQE